MQMVHLPHRLNCPWRATASTAMVRSALSVPSATIGVIQLAARLLATSTSTAVPAFMALTEHTDFLFVVLRIDTLISEAI